MPRKSILSGNYQCGYTAYKPLLLTSVTWMLGTVWEVLALCLAAGIAIKNFRELQRIPTGSVTGDYFTLQGEP